MLKEETARHELEAQKYCLYEELYRRAGSMDLYSFESVYRRIHCIDIKLISFRGGLIYE